MPILVKVSMKTDENKAVAEIDSAVKPENSGNEEIEAAATLQKLRAEEAALMEEKQNWLTLRESLQTRIREEIDSKKNNMQKIKTEMADLKLLCEEMTKALNEGLQEN